MLEVEPERVVYYHELRPGQSLKVVAQGELGAEMLDVMRRFAEFEGELFGKSEQLRQPDRGSRGE